MLFTHYVSHMMLFGEYVSLLTWNPPICRWRQCLREPGPTSRCEPLGALSHPSGASRDLCLLPLSIMSNIIYTASQMAERVDFRATKSELLKALLSRIQSKTVSTGAAGLRLRLGEAGDQGAAFRPLASQQADEEAGGSWTRGSVLELFHGRLEVKISCFIGVFMSFLRRNRSFLGFSRWFQAFGGDIGVFVSICDVRSTSQGAHMWALLILSDAMKPAMKYHLELLHKVHRTDV